MTKPEKETGLRSWSGWSEDKCGTGDTASLGRTLPHDIAKRRARL